MWTKSVLFIVFYDCFHNLLILERLTNYWTHGIIKIVYCSSDCNEMLLLYDPWRVDFSSCVWGGSFLSLMRFTCFSDKISHYSYKNITYKKLKIIHIAVKRSDISPLRTVWNMFNFQATTFKDISMLVMFTDVQVKYLGCFFDDPTQIPKLILSTSSTYRPTECLRRCFEAGYIYSGVQVYLIVTTYF